MEDLNYLLFREQEELMRAQAAACRSSQAAHHGIALNYARRIRDHHLPYRTPRSDGAPFASPTTRYLVAK